MQIVADLFHRCELLAGLPKVREVIGKQPERRRGIATRQYGGLPPKRLVHDAQFAFAIRQGRLAATRRVFLGKLPFGLLADLARRFDY
jgi:hypothetical protein